MECARVITIDDFFSLSPLPTTEQVTLFQSFKRMLKDYDKWLLSNPNCLSFTTFALDNKYDFSSRNQLLYDFLFVREDTMTITLWDEDDYLKRNRITYENLLEAEYPGITIEEQKKWKKQHLFRLLSLPHDKIIISSKDATAMVKRLAEGKIKDYSDFELYHTRHIEPNCLPLYVRSTLMNHFESTLAKRYKLDNFYVVINVQETNEE
jgi:hypothetical protein